MVLSLLFYLDFNMAKVTFFLFSGFFAWQKLLSSYSHSACFSFYTNIGFKVVPPLSVFNLMFDLCTQESVLKPACTLWSTSEGNVSVNAICCVHWNNSCWTVFFCCIIGVTHDSFCHLNPIKTKTNWNLVVLKQQYAAHTNVVEHRSANLEHGQTNLHVEVLRNNKLVAHL